jgi:hypothetical protein
LTNLIGDKLLEFIECERTRYEDSNMFAFGLSQVSRYYRFLSIIYARYTEVSAQFRRIFGVEWRCIRRKAAGR